MTEPRKAVQVSVYMSEADQWHHRPLHLEMLKYLREQEVSGATVLHTVAGFTGHNRVKTATLVDAGGTLPLVPKYSPDAKVTVGSFCAESITLFQYW